MEKSNLYRLAYISKNAIAGNNNDVKHQIEAILASAQKNNPKLDVSGALLYSGGYFCQIIEGPQANIEDLFETIQMDTRHNNITVLSFESIEERGFSAWSMAFAGIEDHMRFDLEGLKHSKEELTGVKAGNDMVSVLAKLVHQQQAISSS